MHARDEFDIRSRIPGESIQCALCTAVVCACCNNACEHERSYACWDSETHCLAEPVELGTVPEIGLVYFLRLLVCQDTKQSFGFFRLLLSTRSYLSTGGPEAATTSM